MTEVAMSVEQAAIKKAKADLKSLGLTEGEDALKGLLDIVQSLVVGLSAKYKWLVYLMPFMPLAVKTLSDIIDKIDGEVG